MSFPQFRLFYNGEEIDKLTPGEEKDLSETLTSSRRPASIKWKGNTVETRKLVIRKMNEMSDMDKMTTYDGEPVSYSKYLELWNKEQEELKNKTPEEKTFRNYKCMFCWKYLLQYGFTMFFGNDEWKRESFHDTFKRFDKKMWEVSPNMVRKFIEESEQYFIDNPSEIWTKKEILNKYLPKGYQSIGELGKNTVKAMSK